MEYLKKEFDIVWRFIKSDIWATIIPGILVTFTSLIHFSIPADKSILLVFVSLIYFFFYEYTFVLSNQLESIEEDKVNKSFRPLPSGLLTKKDVFLRSIVSSVAFIIIGFVLNVGVWATLWVIITFFHNKFGHKHWITKNIISMSLGIFVLIAAGWEIVAPMDNKVLFWALISSFILGWCAVIQDFRDVSGDEKFGRKTLPVDLGQEKGRIVAVLICVISSFSFIVLITYLGLSTVPQILFLAIILLFFIIIAYRIFTYRTEKDDHKTYMILLYLFNLILLSGLVYL